jgi:hypothetical protein
LRLLLMLQSCRASALVQGLLGAVARATRHLLLLVPQEPLQLLLLLVWRCPLLLCQAASSLMPVCLRTGSSTCSSSSSGLKRRLQAVLCLKMQQSKQKQQLAPQGVVLV